SIDSSNEQVKNKKHKDSEKTPTQNSDDKIAQLLTDEHTNITRRNGAKYREQLGILSSTKRRQF
ncbi:MAG: RNA polymerase sigma-54 factor, partial [Gammaproteobacteria bacterium]|nr:RNA polymerase sigma-54 factor [Gammaproteobacteria bacterium]